MPSFSKRQKQEFGEAGCLGKPPPDPSQQGFKLLLNLANRCYGGPRDRLSLEIRPFMSC